MTFDGQFASCRLKTDGRRAIYDVKSREITAPVDVENRKFRDQKFL